MPPAPMADPSASVRHYRRVLSLSLLYGDAAHQLERIAGMLANHEGPR